MGVDDVAKNKVPASTVCHCLHVLKRVALKQDLMGEEKKCLDSNHNLMGEEKNGLTATTI